MTSPIAFSSVTPRHIPEALRLVFHYLDSEDRDQRVTRALKLINDGEIDPAGVIVARDASQLLGAMVCISIPGASGLVWPPQVLGGQGQLKIEDQLMKYAIRWLQQRGAKLAQALLPPSEIQLAIPLERNGFKHITSLWYMRHDLDDISQMKSESVRLSYFPYSAGEHELFHETLLRTYEGSLDCPEVNNIRTVDEIIAGHKAQGIHDPKHWWLALDRQRPVGVLLLTRMPEDNAWDASYLGVVPELRGRGFGRALMTKALREAWHAKADRLSVSVDTRNQLARNLYVNLGFAETEKREVFLATWR